MASEGDLKELQDQRDRRRQDDHLNREREENDLHHKIKEVQELLEKLRKELAEKEKELAEKDKELAEKDKELAEKDKVIEQLKSQKIPSTPPHHGSLTFDDSPESRVAKGNILVALSGDWKRPFWGDSVNVLKESTHGSGSRGGSAAEACRGTR